MLGRTFATSDMDHWQMDGHDWSDMGRATEAQSTRIWRAQADVVGLRETLVERVATELAGEQLEPGEWRTLARYLNRQNTEQHLGMSREALLEEARADALDRTRELCTRPLLRQLLRALAASATTIHSASEAVLGHIVAGGDSKPGRKPGQPAQKTEFVIHSNEYSPTEFPDYLESAVLSSEMKRALGELEARGFIISTPNWRFSHPSYEYAARYAFDQPDDDAVAALERSIFCLEPQNAVIALRLLHDQWRSLDNAADKLEAIAFDALNAILPSVADRALELLVDCYQALDEASRLCLLKHAQRSFFMRDDVIWHDGIPWYDPRELRPYLSENWSKRVGEGTSEASRELEMLGPGALLKPESVFDLLLDSRRTGNPLSDIVMRQALASDSALLRSEAVSIATARADDKFRWIVERATSDPNPQVFRVAVEAVAKAWPQLVSGDRAFALRHMLPKLSHPGRAVLVQQLLAKFSRELLDYGLDDEVPWNLWARLMEPVLHALPLRLRGDVPGWWDQACKAAGRASPELMVKVISAWLDRLECDPPSTSLAMQGLSVCHTLTVATRFRPELRAEVIPRLCNQRSTDVQAVFLAGLIDGWGHLSTTERHRVLELLQSERSDRRWLHAVALTRENPRIEVVRTILDDHALLDAAPGEIIQRFPTRLLNDCLAVYTGYALPLFCLELEGWAITRWDPVLLKIAREPGHVAFHLAIREALWGYQFLHPRLLSREFTRVWSELCACADTDLANRLFVHLVGQSSHITGANFDELWSLLFDAPVAEACRETWTMSILDNFESMQRTHNLKSIFSADESIEARVWEQLQGDRVAWEKISIIREMGDPESLDENLQALREQTIAQLGEQLSGVPCRLSGTLHALRDLVRPSGEGDNHLDEPQWLRDLWDRYHTASSAQRATFPDQYEFSEQFDASRQESVENAGRGVEAGISRQ